MSEHPTGEQINKFINEEKEDISTVRHRLSLAIDYLGEVIVEKGANADVKYHTLNESGQSIDETEIAYNLLKRLETLQRIDSETDPLFAKAAAFFIYKTEEKKKN